MKGFEYVRPSSLEEACRFLHASGGGSMPLAGGTDLLCQMKQEKIRPRRVVSLRDIPGLAGIHVSSGQALVIGAMTPIRAIEVSEEVRKIAPAVAEAAAGIGSPQIRSRATLGGNLCNAAPSADMAPILIAYGATAILSDGQSERSILLEDFFTGPGETSLRSGELMKEVHVPLPSFSVFATYLKAYRSRMDIAVAGVGMVADFAPKGQTCRTLRLVLGAVAPTPIRAKESERLARGVRLDDGLIERVSQKASEEARPISDIRSSADYRKELVLILTRKALRAARAWPEKGGRR